MTTVREEMYDDIIDAALYGCAYWAEGYIRDGVQFIREQDGGDWVKLDRKLIAKGFARVRDGRRNISIRSDILSALLLAYQRPEEASDIDSEAADVLVQVAMFGEIVYG